MLIRIVCILILFREYLMTKSLKKWLFSKRTKDKDNLFLWTLYCCNSHKLLLCILTWLCNLFHTRSLHNSRHTFDLFHIMSLEVSIKDRLCIKAGIPERGTECGERREWGGYYIPGNVPKHSRECRQTFQGMS